MHDGRPLFRKIAIRFLDAKIDEESNTLYSIQSMQIWVKGSESQRKTSYRTYKRAEEGRHRDLLSLSLCTGEIDISTARRDPCPRALRGPVRYSIPMSREGSCGERLRHFVISWPLEGEGMTRQREGKSSTTHNSSKQKIRGLQSLPQIPISSFFPSRLNLRVASTQHHASRA